MPSHNEYILRHPKVILVGTVIDREKINVGSIVVIEMLLSAR